MKGDTDLNTSIFPGRLLLMSKSLIVEDPLYMGLELLPSAWMIYGLSGKGCAAGFFSRLRAALRYHCTTTIGPDVATCCPAKG